MKFLRSRLVWLVFVTAVLVLAGCTQQQRTQDLKERTADATAEAKRDAKAVAEGIREGWTRDNPLNLNTATKKQLTSLPGITAAEADRVIAGRPYKSPADLVTRHIMTKAEYDRVAHRLTVKK